MSWEKYYYPFLNGSFKADWQKSSRRPGREAGFGLSRFGPTK
jgi:hypothetical protein